MTHFVSVGTGAARVQDLSMNPQKLAGQCAKLKCCLNFEIDAYSESHRKLPPKDAVLETKDGLFFYFKPDILARKVTYSTDKSVPANLVTIDAARAFEIIALNKQGIKVDSLEPNSGKEKPKKEYIDLVEQESLTRFDKSKKKKKKSNGNSSGGTNNQNTGGNNSSNGNGVANNGKKNGQAKQNQPKNKQSNQQGQHTSKNSQQPSKGQQRNDRPKKKKQPKNEA